MSRIPLENVVAHWHKLIGNFETSSKDFYTAVELALDHRHIPGLKVSRVKWSEGGVLSPDREYLRVSGDRHSFDMCAAPFGTGYFFSSWVTKKKARFVFLAFLLLISVTMLLRGLFMTVFTHIWRFDYGLFAFIFRNLWVTMVLVPLAMFLVTLWLVALMARAGNSGLELAVIAIPLVGWFYEKVFAPETYYRIDTMLMFQSAVHSAMMETIDGLTMQKGVRGLTEDERKPVFHKLM